MADHIDIGPGTAPDDVDEVDGDTLVLTVEGEAVRRSGARRPSWLPVLGGLAAVALLLVAVGDVLSDVAGVFGGSGDGSLDDLPVLTAEAENPGRYGLYQQNDPAGDADSAYLSPAPPAPLPIASPEVAFDPDVSLASHDGSIIAYVSSGSDVVLRARTGAGQELSAVPVSGGHELRSLSIDGSLAALWRLSPDGEDGQTASEVVVVDTVIGELISRVTIEGLVEPTAFSSDGRVLFVLDSRPESLTGEEPGRYRIRPLDLASGELGQTLDPTEERVDEDPIAEDVSGVGGRQVWGPTGMRLYTLHVGRKAGAGANTDSVNADGGDRRAGFVHVLDLAEEQAFRLDLPEGFGRGELNSTALAVGTDGHIVVLDAQAGRVATMSSVTSTVDNVADLSTKVTEFLGDEGRGSVEMATTGDYLVVARDRQALWLDTVSLEPVGEPVQLAGSVVGLTSGPAPLAWFAAGRAPLELSPPG